MALTLFASTSFNSGGVVRATPCWNEPTVILHDVSNGNIKGSTVVIENSLGGIPVVTLFVDNASISPLTVLWRHFLWGVSGVEGKKPYFKLDRSTKDSPGTIHASWLATSTVDFDTWTQSDGVSLIGGNTGTIEFGFASPMPAGITYISSSPTGRQAEADALATDLIVTTHSAVASPSVSAIDGTGAYRYSQSATNHNGRISVNLPSYAITLDWGGSTTDSEPKRTMVITAMMHAAGEGQQWRAFKSCVDWMLLDPSTEAANFRSNWIVYLYFNYNANGVDGGNSRNTFDNPTEWIGRRFEIPPAVPTSPPEIVDIQAAMLTDTSQSADVMFNWHGDVYSTARYAWWAAEADFLNPTGSYAAINTEVEILFGETPNINHSDTKNDVWFGSSILGGASYDIEISAMRDSSLAYLQDIGQIWPKGVSIADQGGAFNTPTLSVNSLSQSQLIDNITLSQGYNLSVNELVHSQAIDNITLSAGLNLAVSKVVQNHSIDSLVLTQSNTLSISEVNHSQVIDNIILGNSTNLTVNDILHGSVLDPVALTTVNLLEIQGLLSSQLTDGPITLLTEVTLTTGSLTHVHTLDNIVWTVLATPESRTYSVQIQGKIN